MQNWDWMKVGRRSYDHPRARLVTLIMDGWIKSESKGRLNGCWREGCRVFAARALALSVKSCLQDYEMWQQWSLHISRVSGGDLSS